MGISNKRLKKKKTTGRAFGGRGEGNLNHNARGFVLEKKKRKSKVA